MSLWLNSINQIRKVQWGLSHLWDIKFVDPRGKLLAPFNEWFPASDVEENLATLNTFSFEGGIYDNLQVPKSTTLQTVRITFFDDEHHSLATWISNWINYEILGGENSSDPFAYQIAPLQDCVKQLFIQKVNSRQQNLDINAYWVFPEGEITFSGKSTSEVHSYSMNFIVAGKINTV